MLTEVCVLDEEVALKKNVAAFSRHNTTHVLLMNLEHHEISM